MGLSAKRKRHVVQAFYRKVFRPAAYTLTHCRIR
jgi:hypothetical protein